MVSDDPKALLALEPCPWCQRIPKTCPDTSYRTATVFCSDDHDCPVHPIADADLSAGETLDDAVKRWNQRIRPAAEGVREAVIAAADAYQAFAKARAAMNAAIPDVLTATRAERALYDERYKADHEAEREHRRTAVDLARRPDILALLPKPVEGEIEAVVKWLRNLERGWRMAMPKTLADAIERGDYHPTPTSDGVRDDG